MFFLVSLLSITSILCMSFTFSSMNDQCRNDLLLYGSFGSPISGTNTRLTKVSNISGTLYPQIPFLYRNPSSRNGRHLLS